VGVSVVGKLVGVSVVGISDGLNEGSLIVGPGVGSGVGGGDGDLLGCPEGLEKLGCKEGFSVVGLIVGSYVVGMLDGVSVVGFQVGLRDGEKDGSVAVGSTVGAGFRSSKFPGIPSG